MLRKGILLELNSSSGFKTLKPRQDYITLDLESCYGGFLKFDLFCWYWNLFLHCKTHCPQFGQKWPDSKIKKTLMNFRLWNQDKNNLKKDNLTFCWLLLVYDHFVGTEKHIFMLFSTHKTPINHYYPKNV